MVGNWSKCERRLEPPTAHTARLQIPPLFSGPRALSRRTELSQNDRLMGTLVAVTLAAAALLQLIAALLALRAMPHSGIYHYPWIALSLALVLMVERRIQPLFDFHDGVSDLIDALYAFLISALMAFSLVGLGRLLRAIRANQEQLTRLATTDALTGLANRRHLLAELEKELRRTGRSGRPLSVLMVDLDHFKDINDRYGHAVGDAVLVAVAARCLARLRAIDLCGRIGGEEFVVLLPEADAEGAATTAERLRTDLAESPIDTTSGPLRVTISIGVATHRTRSPRANETAEDEVIGRAQTLLQYADDALYRAKASGRNCVRIAVGDSPVDAGIIVGADR
jgi:diguanylate cyclase (GGDEF)-like protein